MTFNVGTNPIIVKKSAVRILTLNCLATRYIEREQLRTFEQRVSLHYQHITASHPDVTFLCEVDSAPFYLEQGADVVGGTKKAPYQFQSLPDQLQGSRPSLQSIHAYKQDDGGKDKDGSFLLFDTETVSLQTSEVYHFSSGSQFALIALFRVRGWTGKGSDYLLMVGQHAKAGRTEECEDLRISHSRELLEFLKSHPVWSKHTQRLVWMGDFNAGPHSYGGKYPSRWYPAVVDSRRDVHQPLVEEGEGLGSSWTNEELPLESLMKQVSKEEVGGNREPTFTTYKIRNVATIAQTIDYMLASKNQFEVVSFMPREFTVDSLPPGGLPCASWGSDHLSLCCDIAPRCQ